VWERDDIAQSVQEVSLPPADVLPTVRVIPAQERGWADVRDFYRDLLISATRTGPQVEAAARAVAGNTEEDKARAIYHGVASKVRSSAGSLADGEVPTAEETLASRVGSRTVALVAIARAAGLHAEVLLARSAGASKPTLASPQAYSRPLVLIRLKKQGGAERAIALDAETEGSGFGALSPTIELGDALLVPIGPSPGAALATARIVPVPGTPRAERSIAEGDVSFDPDGTLIAKIEIRMGAWRGAQMRSVLRGIEPGGRKHFFEQLAMRIFAGASDAEGEVLHEDDPDQPLEIRLSCRASRFLNLAAGSADLDQLVPALGLRKMYVNLVPRKFPLFVDTPLVESATFRVRLPEGVQISHLAPSQQVESEFGNYAVQFRQLAPGQFEVRREFRIPVQVVRPEQYEAFTRFAWRIDHAERQRLSVERAPETVAAR
jgi:hypothetical protein